MFSGNVQVDICCIFLYLKKVISRLVAVSPDVVHLLDSYTFRYR